MVVTIPKYILSFQRYLSFEYANWPFDDIVHFTKFSPNMMKVVSEKFHSLQ